MVSGYIELCTKYCMFPKVADVSFSYILTIPCISRLGFHYSELAAKGVIEGCDLNSQLVVLKA